VTSRIDDRPQTDQGPSTEGTAAINGEMRRPWRSALRNALPAWLTGFGLVIVLELLAARADRGKSVLGLASDVKHHRFHLLYAWDTRWYLMLTEHGYRGNAREGVRFSPLLPLVARVVSWAGIPAYDAILLVCWLAALGFAVLMYEMTRLETGSAVTARRATWLSQLAPGAFVLAMGYTEALTGLLAAAYLLASRRYGADLGARQRWLWLAVGFVAGFGSGLVRPTGFLIASVGAVEIAMRLFRRERLGWSGWTARLLMTAAPGLGVGAFLVWCQAVYGKFLLPYKVQTQIGLRGTVAGNPLSSAVAIFGSPTSRDEVNGAGTLTLALAVASVGLLWFCARRMPASFSVWAALSLLAALTAPYFSSFPRYLSGDLPLLITAALVARSRTSWLWTLGASAALCAFFAYRAFTGTYTP
jgi:hypothetical protein